VTDGKKWKDRPNPQQAVVPVEEEEELFDRPQRAVVPMERRSIVVYTDVSGQPIGFIFKGQEIQEENVDRFSRNVDKDFPVYAA
jgi:hypothetical protein